MAKRVVVWTQTAANQRREILKYWVNINGTTTYAEKLVKLTSQRVKLILSNPRLYKKADFPDTYESAMGHFSIYYKVTSNYLIITAFWDNRQNPKRLLEVLKNNDKM